MEQLKIELEDELSNLEADANNSQNMLYKLKNEKQRWTETRDGLDEQKQYIEGNSILTSSMIVYAGVCFENYRPDLLKIFINKLQTIGIKFNKN